jgi:hypothetical protein
MLDRRGVLKNLLKVFALAVVAFLINWSLGGSPGRAALDVAIVLGVLCIFIAGRGWVAAKRK